MRGSAGRRCSPTGYREYGFLNLCQRVLPDDFRLEMRLVRQLVCNNHGVTGPSMARAPLIAVTARATAGGWMQSLLRAGSAPVNAGESLVARYRSTLIRCCISNCNARRIPTSPRPSSVSKIR